MRTLILCLLCWLVPLAAKADGCGGRDLLPTLSASEREAAIRSVADIPFAEGTLWRATRGATQITVLGTMHLADPRQAAILDRVGPLVQAAELALFEVTYAEIVQLQIRIAKDPSLLMLQDGSLIDLLGETVWAELGPQLAARGLPPIVAARMQPWYVAMLLASPACAQLAESAEAGPDAVLLKAAIAAGVPVQAVEPYDTVFRAFGAAPIEEQIKMVRASIVSDQVAADQVAADKVETLKARYFEERHALAWHLMQVAGRDSSGLTESETDALFDQMERKLVEDRNHAWIPVILEAASGKVAVLAVGAAHLSGTDGVLNLLQSKGFTLERLPL